MHIPGNAPLLEHAEKHSSYLPYPPNPHLAEARRVAEQINKTKIEDPALGYKLYDDLVDSLIENTLAVAKQYEHAPEPPDWSCAQRCVWRFSQLPYDRRHDVVNDRSLATDVKAFAVVNAGRWIVSCVFPGCGGAQYASFNDRRFHCVDCDSKAIGGKWVEVLWPRNLVEIEAALGIHRPLVAQNWVTGETVEDIIKQDEAHMAVAA